jgi:pimeloyl-ACP methyl ester carboxylesterase
MAEQLAVGVGPDRIDVAYERRGNPSDPPALLVMGIAAQLVQWPDGFCDALVERGLQVVRFDNSGAGLRTLARSAPELLARGRRPAAEVVHRGGWGNRHS